MLSSPPFSHCAPAFQLLVLGKIIDSSECGYFPSASVPPLASTAWGATGHRVGLPCSSAALANPTRNRTLGPQLFSCQDSERKTPFIAPSAPPTTIGGVHRALHLPTQASKSRQLLGSTGGLLRTMDRGERPVHRPITKFSALILRCRNRSMTDGTAVRSLCPYRSCGPVPKISDDETLSPKTECSQRPGVESESDSHL